MVLQLLVTVTPGNTQYVSHQLLVVVHSGCSQSVFSEEILVAVKPDFSQYAFYKQLFIAILIASMDLLLAVASYYNSFLLLIFLL